MAIKRTDILVGDYCYNTSNLIAHGAFSIVYKGKHRTNSDLTVAIKTIAKKNRSKSGSSLENEILVLKEINHENIIRLLDYKIINENLYLVLELCNLGDLSDYLQIKGTLSEDTIRIFLKQISNAIKILSAKNIIHRDLKPSNILLTSKYSNPTPDQITVKVADFGFAKFLKRHLTTTTICGSPAYMAPEVLLECDYDIKADLWSIGTILFQCLAGKPPFPAKTVSALIQFYQKNIFLTPAIPIGTSEKLTDLLLNLLKRDAKDRIDHNEFFNHPFIIYEHQDSTLVIQDNGSSNYYSESQSSLESSYESLVSQRYDIDSLKSLDSHSSDPYDWQKRVDDFIMTTEISNNSGNNNNDFDISLPIQTEIDNIHFSSSTSSSSHLITPKPIPVPTKKKAFEKLRRVHFFIGRDSCESNENLSCWNTSTTSRDKENFPSQTTDKSNSTDSDTNSSDNRFFADISQLSPPAQYFCTLPNIPITSMLWSGRQSSLILGNLCSLNMKKNTFSELTADHYSDELIFPNLQTEPNLNIKDNQKIEYDKKTIKLAFHDGSSDGSSYDHLALGSTNYLYNICNNSNDADFFTPLHPMNYGSCCLCKVKRLNMQGLLDTSPVFFKGFSAPELPEETLLDKNHNEILAKLNYIASLVECIIKIAGHRGNTFNILTECNIKKFPTPSQRLAEKFVLYVRGLELVSSALHFSRQKIMLGRLKISSTVRQVLRIMKIFFHECLDKCKLLGMNKLITKNKAELEQINVDKIMYDYAINMCQSAALEESFGNFEICLHRYKSAQLLLHCLSQQVENCNDRIIVMKYKEVVEKRLLILRERGIALQNI